MNNTIDFCNAKVNFAELCFVMDHRKILAVQNAETFIYFEPKEPTDGWFLEANYELAVRNGIVFG